MVMDHSAALDIVNIDLLIKRIPDDVVNLIGVWLTVRSFCEHNWEKLNPFRPHMQYHTGIYLRSNTLCDLCVTTL
jgi:hypothetical protein